MNALPISLLSCAVMLGSIVEAPTPAAVSSPENPSAGATFALRLLTDRSSYTSDQPVFVTVVVQNTSRIQTGIFTRHSAHLDVRLTIIAQGKTLPPNLPFVGEAASERDIGLLPGEKFFETELLSKWRYSLAPGTYDISGEYHYDVNGVMLKANAVHITVTPRSLSTGAER